VKIIDVEQGSLSWLTARAGLVTASEVDALVSPEFAVRKGKGIDTYLAQKLAERWVGGSIANFQTIDMETGQMLENEVLKVVAFELDTEVKRVGLITDDKGEIGCSPDGLLGDDGGLEAKCPMLHTHVKYLLADVVPPEYVAQVQFSLYVTGRKYWRFMSYHRRLPALVKLVEPDPKAQAAFADAVPMFLDRLKTAYKKLCELNGGEPKRNPFRDEILNPKPKYTQGDDVTP
jgi:hypothetical protein